MCLNTKCKNNKSGHLPRRLPFRGMAMNDPRLPPMTLCGRRKGGFLKDPVYWCKNECMLWDDGGRPFLTMGSETTTRPQSIHTHLCNYTSGFICDPISTVDTSLKWLLYDTRSGWGQGKYQRTFKKAVTFVEIHPDAVPELSLWQRCNRKIQSLILKWLTRVGLVLCKCKVSFEDESIIAQVLLWQRQHR